MGNKRYQKYADPLSKAQKKELRHKEYKPEPEKRHLKIISYNSQKLVDILCDDQSTIFDKSIAKEEILRRLNRNEKRIENRKSKDLKTKNKKQILQPHTNQHTSNKKGVHIGSDHHSQYSDFIAGGGDPKSCPFD